MPLKFHCICGQALIVSRRLAGRGVRCPKCDVKVKVPSPRAAHIPDLKRTETLPLPENKPSATLTSPAESPDEVSEEVAESATPSALVRGCEPRPKDVVASHWLALGLAVIALIGVAPAVFDIVSHLRVPDSPGVAVWAYLSLWIAVIEISYAVYLAQLPDWSSLWVATMVTLVVSVAYAMLLGLTYLSRPDSWLARSLDLSEYLAGGRAAGWCFIMLCLTSMMSYLSGRLSVRWHHAGA
jgi:hypothetical protein